MGARFRKKRDLRHASSALALLGLLGAAQCRRSEPERATLRTRPSATAPAPSVQAVALAPVPALAAAPKVLALPSACSEQAPQPFLIHAHFRNEALSSTQAQLAWWSELQRSIRYRTEQYGYYEGFGRAAWNKKPLAHQMRVTKFAGIPLIVHERVIPALRCVERAIERACAAHPYRPRSLAGLRDKNTYSGGDVTNHVYGIALDIDPSDNPCCNCVEPWRSNPRCRGKKPDLERMAMPECWITEFERYGFYWLGHDELKDTMHFEFLGDPSKIATLASD